MYEFLKGHHGEPLSASVARMAMLPAGAEVFVDYSHHWPLIKSQNCFILPGLPVALRDKMGRIVQMLPQAERQWVGKLYLNVEETQLAAWLSELQRRHPDTAIGSYPLFRASYATRITVKSSQAPDCRETFEEARSYFEKRGWLLSVDEPEQVRAAEGGE
jgi:molybdopterin-biosynthesis enzyme MoeA-like protein